mmetsp:Transcript_29415/g.84496  ORF Transcript_29415/g.84496 Transcript_29415/m.84496 type:complete len:314 (-) Transcript_29415:63-1004(-)
MVLGPGHTGPPEFFERGLVCLQVPGGHSQAALGFGLALTSFGHALFRLCKVFRGINNAVLESLVYELEGVSGLGLSRAGSRKLSLSFLQQASQCVHDATAVALIRCGAGCAGLRVFVLVPGARTLQQHGEPCAVSCADRRGVHQCGQGPHDAAGALGLHQRGPTLLHFPLKNAHSPLQHVNGLCEFLVGCRESRGLLGTQRRRLLEVCFVPGKARGELLRLRDQRFDARGLTRYARLEFRNLALARLDLEAQLPRAAVAEADELPVDLLRLLAVGRDLELQVRQKLLDLPYRRRLRRMGSSGRERRDHHGDRG